MPGLVRGVARTAVVAGTATAVSNRVSPPPGGSLGPAGSPAAGRRGTQAPAQAAPPTPAADPIEKLKELGELRDKGVLTEDEFNAQKAKLLAS